MGAAQQLRLARLVGRDHYVRAGLAEGAAALDAGQRARLAALVDARLEAIAAALVEEAAASDDVTSFESAMGYATDALAFLDDLLSPPQRAAVLNRFGEAAARWRTGARD